MEWQFTCPHNAKLLLLDEPTSGLDPAAREDVLDILRDYLIEDERTVLFSTHITSDLERIADLIVYISQGVELLIERTAIYDLDDRKRQPFVLTINLVK